MKKSLFVPAFVAGVSMGAMAGRAEFTIVTANGTIAAITVPTAAVAGSTAASSAAGPNKETTLKLAAIEAAEYRDSGNMGVILSSIVNANPDKDKEEVINLVLEAADSL